MDDQPRYREQEFPSLAARRREVAAAAIAEGRRILAEKRKDQLKTRKLWAGEP